MTGVFVYLVDLNNIYSVIINTIVNIYTMSCETGSDRKHKAYINLSHLLWFSVKQTICVMVDTRIRGNTYT